MLGNIQRNPLKNDILVQGEPADRARHNSFEIEALGSEETRNEATLQRNWENLALIGWSIVRESERGL